MPGKSKNIFAIHVLNLQNYNFELFKTDEIILLEYLFVKAKAFDFQWFYYSFNRITNETGIKRTRLEIIFKDFTKAGFLHIEKRGYPFQNQFFVNVAKFVDSNLFIDLYKEKPNTEIVEFWQMYKSEFLTAQGVKTKASIDVDKFINELNQLYNQRRERVKGKMYSKTSLAITQKALINMRTALQLFDHKSLINSFIAYSDAVIDKDENPDLILNYWLTKDESGDYILINRYLDYFNQNYEITK